MTDSTDPARLHPYLERYFVPLAELAALGGASPSRVRDLIAARAIPGPICSTWPNGAFWSAVGGSHGDAPRGEPRHWYAPAAAWSIRRCRDMAPDAAALALEARFVADFVDRLAAESQGRLGCPQVCETGAFDPVAAAQAARAEWRDWLDGGYGVCLRHADARHAITKTCRRATVSAPTDEGRAARLDPARMDALLTALEEPESVMLPFAPHRRPQGTPGLWIDATLVRYGLGRTREMGAVATAVPDDFRT